MKPNTQARPSARQETPNRVSYAPLYERAGAQKWGVSSQRFTQALDQSAARRFPDGPPRDPQELQRYFDSLKLEDLALACACADGEERAWTEFVSKHSEALYGAARAIVGLRNEAAAKELADSLYAELYGIGRGTNSHGSSARRPLFDYFHGRSKLDTWLRAVLSQRYVDKLRENSRYVPLDGDRGMPQHRASAGSRDPERVSATFQLHEAMSAAVGELPPRDRLAVSLYYVRSKTLAEIGTILGEHESSVSRRLDRTRQGLRKSVEERLKRQGLSEQQISLCFDCADEEGPFDLSRSLAGHSQPAENTKHRGSESLRIQLPPGAPPLEIPRDKD